MANLSIYIIIRRVDNMPKRSRDYNTSGLGARKRRRITSGSRSTYKTVPRTRGVYDAGEMKYFDTFVASANLRVGVDWTGSELDPATYLNLCNPIQGAGINQRIGKMAKLYKIKVKGFLVAPAQQNAANGLAGQAIRVLLVQDMQSNSTQMTGTQLMTSTALGARVAVQAYQNSDNFGRFRVLKEKMVVINAQCVDYDGNANQHDIWGVTVPFKMTLSFKKPIEVHFNSTNGGTIADVIDHSFHIVANTDTTDLQVNITYNCRCSFKE